MRLAVDLAHVLLRTLKTRPYFLLQEHGRDDDQEQRRECQGGKSGGYTNHERKNDDEHNQTVNQRAQGSRGPGDGGQIAVYPHHQLSDGMFLEEFPRHLLEMVEKG